MSVKTLIITVLMGVSLVASAGTIQYNSNAESGFQWIHAPDSTVASPTYVQTDSIVTFYNQGTGTPITTGNWNGEGWLQGNFSYSTDSTIFAQVVIGSGTYAGYYQNLNPQAVAFPIGNELIVYDTGGTNPDGTGWVVPEPGTWALFGIGLMTLVGAKFRRR